MPDNITTLAQEPAMWCSNTCPGAEAHEILRFISDRFQENKANGGLCSEGWQELKEKLPDLSTILYKVKCYRLNALAIHVCKESAFLNIEHGSTFVKQLYEVICNVWNKGHSNGQNLGNVDNFLDGWIQDLSMVKNQWLPIYLQILACDNLVDNPKFVKAIEALEEHLKKLIDNPDLIDDCGEQLIAYVLEFFLDTNPQRIVECFSIATKIAILKPSDSKLKSVKALRQLVEHLKAKATKSLQRQSNDVQLDLNLLSRNNEKLSKAFEDARKNNQFNLCRELELLIPLVGNWERPRHLKAPQGSMKVVLPSGEQFDSVPKDIDKDGIHYHVCFDDIVEAAVVKGSTREVDPKQKCPIKIVDLYIKHKNGNKYQINEATAVFNFGGKDVTTKIYAARGWKYRKLNQEHAGAVFSVVKPPIKKKDLSRLEALAIGEGEAENNDYIDGSGKSEQKLNPKRVLRLGRNKLNYDIPFYSGPEGLVKGIEEFFKVLSDTILFNKWSQLFWTKKKPRIPMNELEVDATIRPLFQSYVESRNGNLICQEDPGLGRCDYVVYRGNDNVVIELKCSSHKQLKQGIEAELPTLMTNKNTKFGIFLLFAFYAAFKKDSDELNNLIKLRNNISKKMDLNISIMIVNCDKPKTASKRKKTARRGDGLQSY